MSAKVEHLMLPVHDLRLHVAVAGEGPLVVLLHGFPELWSAWHHQIPQLAAAGYRVAAPDLRGFGQSDAPDDPHAYSVVHAAGDVIGVIEALGERTASVVGHDFGAPVAWHTALFRPDVIRSVVALNGPYRVRAPKPPLQMLREAGHDRHYWFYMQRAGTAGEFERDVAKTMRAFLAGASGDAPKPHENSVLVPEGGSLFDVFEAPAAPPSWVDPEHFARLVSAYERTGFQKPLYLYHNVDSNWALTAAWSGKRIEQPALHLAGDRDLTMVSPMAKRALDALPSIVPNVAIEWIEGAGHWLQQEKPAEVTAALLAFLRAHPPRSA